MVLGRFHREARVVTMQAAKRQTSTRTWLALVAVYLLAVQSVLSALAGASHTERQIERMLAADSQVLCLSDHTQSDQQSPVHGNDCCTWACNAGTSLAAAPISIDLAAPRSFA